MSRNNHPTSQHPHSRATTKTHLQHGKMPINTRFLLVLLALTAFAPGCGGDFDPPSRINSLRPLALRATPPYLDPDPAAETKLDALVVGASDGAELCYAWGLCALTVNADGAYKCADPRLSVALSTQPTAKVDFGHLGALLAGAQSIRQERGVGQTQPERSEQPQAGGEQPSFSVKIQFAVAEKAAMGGVCPQDIAAFLATGCADRQRCVLGQKSLTVGAENRVNPAITALASTWVADTVSLTPQWTASSQTALFSWFSTAGEYSKQRSYDAVAANELKLGTESKARVWVVARDGDGGVGWWQQDIARGEAGGSDTTSP